jgi:hypothetical protein
MAKVICPECQGEGKFGPGFVWTADEVAEQDPGEFAETQRMLREGYFDTACEFCKGVRVVEDVIEEDGVRTTAQERWRDFREYRAEVAAEQRFGC